MRKIISLAAAVLAIAVAGFWIKSNVSETAANSRPVATKSLAMDERQLGSDTRSLPVQKVDDRTFVFTDAD